MGDTLAGWWTLWQREDDVRTRASMARTAAPRDRTRLDAPCLGCGVHDTLMEGRIGGSKVYCADCAAMIIRTDHSLGTEGTE